MPSSSPSSISPRRLEANRRNAQLSTGPRTPEGKARVAQNRTTHALTGAHTILTREDPQAFARLLAALIEEHAPATETEAHQVELLAHNQWKLRRAAQLETEAFEASLTAETAANGRPTLTDAIMRVARYMASIRRSYSLALAELHRLQAARRKAAQAELAEILDLQLTAPSLPSPLTKNDSNPTPPTKYESVSSESLADASTV